MVGSPAKTLIQEYYESQMKKRKNSSEAIKVKRIKTTTGNIEISSQTKSKTNGQGQSFSSAVTRHGEAGQRHDANLRILDGDKAHFSSAQRAYADE